MVQTGEKPDREVLEGAIAILDNPEHWCQHYAGVDETGRPQYPEEDVVVQWCMVGALTKAAGEGFQAPSLYIHNPQLSRICGAIMPGGGTPKSRIDAVTGFNDRKGRLHSDVVLAMKRGLDNLA